MPVFIDTNVIAYASAASPSEIARACTSILEAIEAEELDARTSVAVLEEIWHLELRHRPPDLDGLALDAYTLFTPLLPVTDEIVRDALALAGGSLGANDRVHVATCNANGIETIVSADAGFDAAPGINRVDPLDERAVGALLGGD